MTDMIMIAVSLVFLLSAAGLYYAAVMQRRSENWEDRILQIFTKSDTTSDTKSGRAPPAAQFLQKRSAHNRKSEKTSAAVSRILTAWGGGEDQARTYLLAIKILSASTALIGYSIWRGDIWSQSTDIYSWMGGAVLFSFAGFWIPDKILGRIYKRKRRAFERLAPDVIDLLMLAVEAGISFDVALIDVRRSIGHFNKALARELALLSDELNILPQREAAFDNLVRRTGSETFRYLKVALLQGEKYGTPIVQSLRVVATESRQQDLLAKEEKARKLPVLLSIPLMLLILPPVVVISAGPGFIQLMRAF